MTCKEAAKIDMDRAIARRTSLREGETKVILMAKGMLKTGKDIKVDRENVKATKKDGPNQHMQPEWSPFMRSCNVSKSLTVKSIVRGAVPINTTVSERAVVLAWATPAMATEKSMATQLSITGSRVKSRVQTVEKGAEKQTIS